MDSEYKDGLVFTDPDTNEQIVVNFKTWISILMGVIVEYGNKTLEEAEVLIGKRNFVIPESYSECVFYSHEVEYHWAMLLLYGEGYWNQGISTEEPENYSEWEKKYRDDNSLKAESFEFD